MEEKKLFNPLEHKVCLSFPLWLTETAWAEHLPFAMFVVSAVKPKFLVELGAWRGVSYCAFCQAVKELNLATRCYAVDTWRGDEHAGNLGDEALRLLRVHHDPLYADFSRLVQSTFDEALDHFSDNSIDLLHIDGFHTYEAVRHDFETWLPKMSESGVVLFHDINVRERGFGVYKFWEEICKKYPHFDFLHGHGLGVLAVGEQIPENLKFLFEAAENEVTTIREFFFALGSRIGNVIQLRQEEKVILAKDDYIARLQSYEKTVKKSRIMRGYRLLQEDGFSGVLKKIGGERGESDQKK